MTDVPVKYVIPIMVLASVPLGIAAYHLVPASDTVNAEPPISVEITLPDSDIRNACKSAYSELLVLGNSVQTSDCVDHKFIDRNTGMVAFDVMGPDGPKRMQFAVRRRPDGNNWDLFDPKTGKLWSETLGN
jgi:hypothetical protein